MSVLNNLRDLLADLALSAEKTKDQELFNRIETAERRFHELR